jgi:hypothetical protein
VSSASEIEQCDLPDVPVNDTSGEHGSALPEHPAQVQPEEVDTHSNLVQEQPERSYPLQNRRPPNEWWNPEAIRARAQQQVREEQAAEDGSGAGYVTSVASDTSATYAQAMDSSEAKEWKMACDDELASLMQHKVWTCSKAPPKDTKVVRSRWVFKKKLNAMGLVERYKAMLFAKGFTQRSGIDYDEVWAPVGKHATFRSLLAVAAAQSLEVNQMDVKTAFVHGDLEDIWMPPEGYVLGAEEDVCWIQKSIYGLKQASRSWHSKLKCLFGKERLMPSTADPGLFIRRDGDSAVCVCLF